MYDSTNTNGLTERSLGRTPTNFAIRSILGNLTRSGLSRQLAKCMDPLMSVTRRLLMSGHFPFSGQSFPFLLPFGCQMILLLEVVRSCSIARDRKSLIADRVLLPTSPVICPNIELG